MYHDLAVQIERSNIRLVRVARDGDEGKDWITVRHKHEGIELLYLLVSGGASIEASEQRIGVSAYDVVAYPAGVYHEEFLDRTQHQGFYCLELDADFTLPEMTRITDKDGQLLWLFSNIYQEFSDENCSEPLLAHYIKALLLNIVLKMGVKRPQMGVRIEQYIKANFKEDISVRKVAEAMHVSESYAYRVLKKRVGCSPVQFLSFLRMEEAKRLLLTTDKTVEEISRMVGISSQKYFSRVFRKHYGSTPSSFRQNN